MTERNFDVSPYTPEEQRVCDYLQEITDGSVGCGDDPIGFLIASHSMMVLERKAFIKTTLIRLTPNEARC